MRTHKILAGLLVALLAWVPLTALADVQIKSGATTDTLTVNTNKAALTVQGISTRATYIASSSALVTTATYNLSIEAGAAKGFKLVRICVGYSNATAAVAGTIAINRRTTASSAGTALTAEGTGADSISKMDPADGAFSGIARRTSTLGTIGATLDQIGVQFGIIATGAGSEKAFCKDYGNNGEKSIFVAAGTANGISITVTAPGAGGLASGSISAVIIEE